MSKIAMIGDRDSIWPFKAFGVSLYLLKSMDEAKEALKRALSQDHAIIFVTEEVFKACREEIYEVQDRPTPAITILPSLRGSQGLGMEEIKEAVRKAIGAEIL